MKKNEVRGSRGFEEEHSEESSSSLAFRGNFIHTVDGKGRVSLPAEFRKILTRYEDHSVVLTNYISDGSRCLEGFSLSNWIEFERTLRAKSRFSPKLQKLENFYLSRSAECAVDGSGRILLPSHLRQYGGLEKEVTFTASIHGFRIWDTRVWDQIFRDTEAALLEDPELFADIDI